MAGIFRGAVFLEGLGKVVWIYGVMKRKSVLGGLYMYSACLLFISQYTVYLRSYGDLMTWKF